jgi:hypothetical protein
MGGQWPQAMTVVGGVVHQIYAEAMAGHDGSTGLAADGASAVNMGGQWPQAITVS